MINFEEGHKNFLSVRDKLKSDKKFQCAANRCWHKPFKFYRTHTLDEAIDILINECLYCKEFFEKEQKGTM